MDEIDDHRSMFKTTFVDADGGRDLAGPIYLPSIPERGEPVNIKERSHHGRSISGHVTRREWNIVTKDPGESEVVISLAVD